MVGEVGLWLSSGWSWRIEDGCVGIVLGFATKDG